MALVRSDVGLRNTTALSELHFGEPRLQASRSQIFRMRSTARDITAGSAVAVDPDSRPHASLIAADVDHAAGYGGTAARSGDGGIQNTGSTEAFTDPRPKPPDAHDDEGPASMPAGPS